MPKHRFCRCQNLNLPFVRITFGLQAFLTLSFVNQLWTQVEPSAALRRHCGTDQYRAHGRVTPYLGHTIIAVEEGAA